MQNKPTEISPKYFLLVIFVGALLLGFLYKFPNFIDLWGGLAIWGIAEITLPLSIVAFILVFLLYVTKR